MADMLTLVVAPRDSQTNKALRRAAFLPATVYGRDFTAQSVQVGYRDMESMLAQAGTSSVLLLAVEGQAEPHMVLLRDVQRDPVTNRILHLDFYRVIAGDTIRNEVPLVVVGVAPVIELGAVVSQVLNALEIECMPKDMPHSIHVDVSGLKEMHHSIKVSDLVIPPGVDVLTDLDADVIQVLMPRAMMEEEEVEEIAEGELGAGEAGVEGAAETEGATEE
jgi:large subunit ribosomal protein L25